MACCGAGDRTRRHNLIRDLVYHAAFAAGFSPELEKPGLLAQRLKENEFKEAQNRRSQTEARIAILSNCFCGSPMKQKGFDHRQIHMGLSILSHNLWVLARLKIEQEAARQKAA